MDPQQLAHDAFFHVRVIIGLVTGLCITRLLSGLARFVQHPARPQIYGVHLGWVFFLLLAVMNFWWFEFELSHVMQWTFPRYLFVVSYASLFFFISTLLFPDRMDDYAGFADYFHARQRWFYGILATIFVVDIVDTTFKGVAHLKSLGPFYLLQQVTLAALAVVAVFVGNRRFHVAFVLFALALEILLIARKFDFLS